MGGRAEYSSTPELNQKGNSEFSSHVKMGDRETNTVQALQFILKQESDFLFKDICQQGEAVTFHRQRLPLLSDSLSTPEARLVF